MENLSFNIWKCVIYCIRMEVDIMADICTCCGKKIPFLDVDYDYIEINKLANTTYIGICSTIANFSNDEYDKLIEWCLSVMAQMKEELSNA